MKFKGPMRPKTEEEKAYPHKIWTRERERGNKEGKDRDGV